MQLKEKFQNHPVIFGLSLLAGGFIAGLATYKGISDIVGYRQHPLVIREVFGPLAITRDDKGQVMVSRVVADSVYALTTAHNQRLKELQKRLLEEEEKANNFMNPLSINSKKMVKRIKEAIKDENAIYKEAISSLRNLRP